MTARAGPATLAPGARRDQRSRMSLVSFESLPDQARLWCFGASQRLDDHQTQRLQDSMADFVSEWTAHRRDLRAGFTLLHGHFLLVAVDESAAGASGCSIDALMGRLRSLGTALDLDFLDSMPVWYRDPSGRIGTTSRAGFTDLGRSRKVSASTPVFDLTLTKLADLRAGRLEATAGDTWHRGLLTPG